VGAAMVAEPAGAGLQEGGGSAPGPS
jgi:hypothetical protein